MAYGVHWRRADNAQRRSRRLPMEGHMEAKAKLAGHPIHPMLIVFPLGLLATALAFDVGQSTPIQDAGPSENRHT